MQTYRGSVIAMARHPSGYRATGPVGLRAGLAGRIPGRVRPRQRPRAAHDEGAAAHIYQLLIGVQLLIIPWFALRWGWRDAKAGVGVLALQVLAILASFGPLWLIEH